MMELCDLAEILGTVDEAEEIVARARMWRWKPYGEVRARAERGARRVVCCACGSSSPSTHLPTHPPTRPPPWLQVTLRYAQDGRGQPIDLMQEPLHYPHGTKWMAPGPLGQVHPLPEDK